MVKIYDAKPETVAKQHDLICALSHKSCSIQRGNLVPKQLNYVLIAATNANTARILDTICF